MNLNLLISFLSKSNILYIENEDMRKYTTFKIGGIAPLIILPKSTIETEISIKFMIESGIKYLAIGKGSNLLISDDNINVVFIKTEYLNLISIDEMTITVGAGCLNCKLANLAKEKSLSGFEFAHGIPGTVAGAFYMNAGAYGEDISNIAIEAEYIDKNGSLKTLKAPDFEFSYRHSCFGPKDVICSVKLKLIPGNPSDIKKKMDLLMQKRKATQPLEYPSAGSIFKRPEGYYTGQLIQDCGLKGFSIGGAKVSEKHTGFIINTGNATCRDVCELIAYIQKTVYDSYGVKLETEVRKI